MLAWLKQCLSKTCDAISSRLGRFFDKAELNQADLHDLERSLLEADLGARVTAQILQAVRRQAGNGAVSGDQLRLLVRQHLCAAIAAKTFDELKPVVLFVGINGAGKTTAIAKLAHQLQKRHKRVLLVAADTFRAAAVQQLEQWAQRLECPVVTGAAGADPASVAFNACEQFKRTSYDALLIDTAGRLQTKVDLMHELSKMRRVVEKQVGYSPTILLVLDGMLGQNSLEQARVFKEAVGIDGIVLTKMDGSGRGGALFGIVQELAVPVAYITYGESVDALMAFDAGEYVDALLEK